MNTKPENLMVSRAPAMPKPFGAGNVASTSPVESLPPLSAHPSRPAHQSQEIADTRERWLFSQGNLDYGPFSASSIVEQISDGTIQPGSQIIDNDTGERIGVETHPHFAGVLQKAQQKRNGDRRAHAEAEHVQKTKKRSLLLYLSVTIAVLGIAIGTRSAIKTLSNNNTGQAPNILSLEEGSIKSETKPLAPPQRKTKSTPRKIPRADQRAAARGDTTAEWNDTLSLDMASGDKVGSETLSNSQVNTVIQGFGSRLGRCLRTTRTRHAFIEFIVKGSGKVHQVRVNGNLRTPVCKCVRKVMMMMSFPSFNGVRSKHNFELSR